MQLQIMLIKNILQLGLSVRFRVLSFQLSGSREEGQGKVQDRSPEMIYGHKQTLHRRLLFCKQNSFCRFTNELIQQLAKCRISLNLYLELFLLRIWIRRRNLNSNQKTNWWINVPLSNTNLNLIKPFRLPKNSLETSFLIKMISI